MSFAVSMKSQKIAAFIEMMEAKHDWFHPCTWLSEDLAVNFALHANDGHKNEVSYIVRTMPIWMSREVGKAAAEWVRKRLESQASAEQADSYLWLINQCLDR